MSNYNGWSNRATWNVALWLGNDEPPYRSTQRLVRCAESIDTLADELETFCSEVWPNGRTPDNDKLSECDWQELAKSEWEDGDRDKEN